MHEKSDDQVGSEDEYQISLDDGVDDESLKEDPGSKNFSITSYGADYTVDGLVKRMKSGSFVIPKFQRRFIWSQKHASKFIESLLMGLPIPSIFLYKEKVTNQQLVIDGQQRLRTLEAFYDGTFGERKFRLTGVMEPWNNKTYDDLSSSDQLKIDDSIIHATIFQQDSPEDHNESIYYVFERINSGGIRLSPQEIRNCVSDGPFIELVKALNQYKNWREIFGPLNKRSKDEELIVRFFAMLLDGNKYTKPMSDFLNRTSNKYNGLSAESLSSLKTQFERMCDMTVDALGEKPFRPSRALNAAVFDSVAPALSERLSSSLPPCSAEAVRESYQNLLQDGEFMKACESGTSAEENVRIRRQKARAAFGF